MKTAPFLDSFPRSRIVFLLVQAQQKTWRVKCALRRKQTVKSSLRRITYDKSHSRECFSGQYSFSGPANGYADNFRHGDHEGKITVRNCRYASQSDNSTRIRYCSGWYLNFPNGIYSSTLYSWSHGLGNRFARKNVVCYV